MGLLDKGKKREGLEIRKPIQPKEKPILGEYQTDLDRLYDIIKEKKFITLKDASSLLTISETKVEEWAKILSSENLVEIDFPAFGSPLLKLKGYKIKKEFKKNAKSLQLPKIKFLKKIILFVIVGVLFFFLLFFLLKSTKEIGKTPSIVSSNTTESEDTGIYTTVDEAFSGTGEYECRLKKEDVEAKYSILDTKLRIETKASGIQSIVIIKDGFTYTYLKSQDIWIKVKTAESTILPGSGKSPVGFGVEVQCAKKEVDENLFSIPAEKIK